MGEKLVRENWLMGEMENVNEDDFGRKLPLTLAGVWVDGEILEKGSVKDRIELNCPTSHWPCRPCDC